MLSSLDLVYVGLAGLGAGVVNALAGGGTLISFPVLMAVGVPAVAANVTNTVALCPGYLGATLAQRRDLAGQTRRLWAALPAAAAGGVAGAWLLLHTGDRSFRAAVPYLILVASLLLALQDPLRAWLLRRSGRDSVDQPSGLRAAVPVGLSAIYGGYFGAGLSVIVLALLGIVFHDSITRLNALKQAIALAVNVAAAVFFLASGQVVWPAAIVMAAGALAGGALGGRLASIVPPSTLRRVVVIAGVVVAIIYLSR